MKHANASERNDPHFSVGADSERFQVAKSGCFSSTQHNSLLRNFASFSAARLRLVRYCFPSDSDYIDLTLFLSLYVADGKVSSRRVNPILHNRNQRERRKTSFCANAIWWWKMRKLFELRCHVIASTITMKISLLGAIKRLRLLILDKLLQSARTRRNRQNQLRVITLKP